MIELSNGHRFEYATASGAMGFYGDGWWFEQPWRWLGLLRPGEFTIIIKTLTSTPRKGNLNMWKPWQCVQLLQGGGAINAVGLTNPGMWWWLDGPYRYICKKGYKVIVSLMPETKDQAKEMAYVFNRATKIVGVELNVSCPNVSHDASVEHICGLTRAFCSVSKHPVILKLSYHQPYLDICQELQKTVEAFDVINTIPWPQMFDMPSPLAKYGLVGGVSGLPIVRYAREALAKIKATVPVQVLSGGGIASLEETKLRFELGADAVSFGSVFMRYPWVPNRIIRILESGRLRTEKNLRSWLHKR